jgi:hypothetical protein
MSELLSLPNLGDSRKLFHNLITNSGSENKISLVNDRKKKNPQFLELKSILAAKVPFGRTVHPWGKHFEGRRYFKTNRFLLIFVCTL